MRVLVACEYSATVRDAFRALGHEAWSCDLLPCEGDARWHLQEDVIDVIEREAWDLMIAHPPCTHLAVSGARWFSEKWREQGEAIGFFWQLMAAPVYRICIENPVSIISTRIRKPDQIIQPWQFGEGHMPMAEKSAAPDCDGRGRRARGARASDAAEPRSLERTLAHVCRHCRSDGEPMGRP
jgi:hypothetical protein